MQMVERDIDRETVDPPEESVRIAYEQEECIEEEIFDMSFPILYRAEESVHTYEIKLKTPKMNAVEINELPKEVKLEMPIEQIESKTMQNVSLVNDVPTQFHVVPSKKIMGKIPKLHTRQRKVLGSKIVRRAKTTRLLKRKIPSICRPPPELPDRQNGLNVKVSKRRLSKIHYANEERVNYRHPPTPPSMVNANREGMGDSEKEDIINNKPPPKPPYIVNASGEVIGIIENMVPKPRPPPKPPRIHRDTDREGIKHLEKECLLDTILNYRPPPKPPPKSL